MIQGFTRQETIALTGCDSNRLSYLDRTNIISPVKVGNPKKPKCFYSAEQIVRLKLLNHLEDRSSNQGSLKLIQALNDDQLESISQGGRIALISKSPHLLNDSDSWEMFGKCVLEVARQNDGDVCIVDLGLFDVLGVLYAQAEKEHIPDFVVRMNL